MTRQVIWQPLVSPIVEIHIPCPQTITEYYAKLAKLPQHIAMYGKVCKNSTEELIDPSDEFPTPHEEKSEGKMSGVSICSKNPTFS